MKPFDFVNSINITKKNLMRGSYNDELSEKAYIPFLTNRSLSYFTDTLLYANEMNRYPTLDNKLQYEYLLNSIRTKKRFSKWFKKGDAKQLELIAKYLKVSLREAKEYQKVLTDNQKEQIEKQFEDLE
jgi:hypothetical protein